METINGKASLDNSYIPHVTPPQTLIRAPRPPKWRYRAPVSATGESRQSLRIAQVPLEALATLARVPLSLKIDQRELATHVYGFAHPRSSRSSSAFAFLGERASHQEVEAR